MVEILSSLLANNLVERVRFHLMVVVWLLSRTQGLVESLRRIICIVEHRVNILSWWVVHIFGLRVLGREFILFLDSSSSAHKVVLRQRIFLISKASFLQGSQVLFWSWIRSYPMAESILLVLWIREQVLGRVTRSPYSVKSILRIVISGIILHHTLWVFFQTWIK